MFWGIWYPKWGVATTGSQKSTLLLETRHITQVVKIGRWRSAIPRINKETKKEKRKKKEKGRLRNQKMWRVTCSPIPPTLSHRHMDLHAWPYPRHSYIYGGFIKIRSGGLEPQGGVEISPFPLLRLLELLLTYKSWNGFCTKYEIQYQLVFLLLYSNYIFVEHFATIYKFLNKRNCLSRIEI